MGKLGLWGAFKKIIGDNKQEIKKNVLTHGLQGIGGGPGEFIVNPHKMIDRHTRRAEFMTKANKILTKFGIPNAFGPALELQEKGLKYLDGVVNHGKKPDINEIKEILQEGQALYKNNK